jgi:hypothetical protein
MSAMDEPKPEETDNGWFPGWRALAFAIALYTACVVTATYPRVMTLRTQLPGVADSVTHLWTLRWNKDSLLRGHSPFFNPGIQAPVGSPVGLVPPMHLQTLFYLLASSITRNDILCYNAIWFSSFVTTGVGIFWLAWFLVRDRISAMVAGLLGMLSTPMMSHGFGHLELIQVGWFPLFLIAWIRLVDRPGGGRLVAASVLYLLVAMSAPYFAVFAVYPAVLYAIWATVGAFRSGGPGVRAWIGPRLVGTMAFLAVTMAGLTLLYSGQLWAAIHGFSVTRNRTEFLKYGAPPWAYFVPTQYHLLGKLLPFDAYQRAGLGDTAGERASYLGAVSVVLVLYAAVRRVRFPRMSYWWAVLGLLVVLSFGASWRIGPVKVGLPASWGLDSISPLRLLRVPARFNLFAAVFAAVIAAAALKDLLGRLSRPGVRATLAGLLMAIALADQSIVPFGSSEIPTMPTSYSTILRADPDASFVEGPQYTSGDPIELSALGAYWQSFHRGRTTAGYTAHPNLGFDGLIAHASPFSIWDLAHPHFLDDPEDTTVDLFAHIGYRDYVWLFLTRHDLRFVVLHKRPMAISGYPVRLDRVRTILAGAQILEDADTIVFDRNLMPRPTRPIAICTEGWRQTLLVDGRRARSMAKVGHLALFNPDPTGELTISLDALAFRKPRTVRLMAGPSELARWIIEPGPHREVASPPFRVLAGLQEISIESDDDDQPTRNHELPADGDRRPVSLRVLSIGLKPTAPTTPVATGLTASGESIAR